MTANALEGSCHPSFSVLPAPIHKKAVILFEDSPLPIMERKQGQPELGTLSQKEKDKRGRRGR